MMQVRDTELPGCSTDHPPPYQCYELPRETRPGCSTGLPPSYKCYELPSYSELYNKDTPRNRREDHTVLVIQAQSSHENNEETQNLNQGNTNENENPSKGSRLCGMCIIFFLFYLILLLAIQLSNTEPVVYTPSQPDVLNPTIPTYWRFDPTFRTTTTASELIVDGNEQDDTKLTDLEIQRIFQDMNVRLEEYDAFKTRASESIQKMLLANYSTTIVTPTTRSLKPTNRGNLYAKETTTTERPRRRNRLRTEHNDIEDEDSVDMDENLRLTWKSNSHKDTSPTIATQTTMTSKFRWPFVWDPDDRVFRFRTVNYNFEDEN